jgi:hypothetical protein
MKCTKICIKKIVCLCFKLTRLLSLINIIDFRARSQINIPKIQIQMILLKHLASDSTKSLTNFHSSHQFYNFLKLPITIVVNRFRFSHTAFYQLSEFDS